MPDQLEPPVALPPAAPPTRPVDRRAPAVAPHEGDEDDHDLLLLRAIFDGPLFS